MTSASVVLYKKLPLNDGLNSFVGFKGFLPQESLKFFILDQLDMFKQKLPKNRIRVLLEKKLEKNFFNITLHIRIKGKDFCLRQEDICPFGLMKNSIAEIFNNIEEAKNLQSQKAS